MYGSSFWETAAMQNCGHPQGISLTSLFKTETSGEQVILNYCNYWNYSALFSYCDYSILLLLLWLLYSLYIILIIVHTEIIDVIVLVVWCWQVRVDLGLPDHIWVNKRAAIAKQVDDLGDEFRPAMRNLKGWLAYITKTYAADLSEHAVAIGQGESVVPHNEWCLWGPWPTGLVFTLNTDPNHSFVLPNNCNNCSNNDNNWQ